MPSLKLLTTVAELRLCITLQERVWGLEEETFGASHMVAVNHAGGMTAGAFEAGALVGFVFGFPSYQPRYAQPNGLHSHLLAVAPKHRGRGIGKKLKWFQRQWCLARDLPWMTWTFDPLQAKNARLNLEHLGAVASEYRIDEYGTLGGSLSGVLPTDRFLTFWNLTDADVTRLAQRLERPTRGVNTLPVVLTSQNGKPGVPDLSQTVSSLRAEIPPDFTHLLHHDPDTALAWRLALREVMQTYLSKGYTVTRFVAPFYLLEKSL